MNYEDVFKSFEKKSRDELDYLNNLTEEKRSEISKNEIIISEEIKLKLDLIPIQISDIQTFFRKDFKTKDGEVMDIFYTVFTTTGSQRPISVVSNLKKEMLYVKVSINKFLSVEEFFSIKE